MNASNKDGLSSLLEVKNGCDLYGKFWLLQEHFYFAQLNNEIFKTTIRIHENVMLRVLKTNRRRLGNVLETFREVLGIVSECIQEPFGIVYETTIPMSLIYINKRNPKDAIILEENRIEENREKKIFPLKSSKELDTGGALGTMPEEGRDIARDIAKKHKTVGRTE